MNINEKTIYNTFLKVSRTSVGLPYRLRKHWDGFEETEYFVLANRLKNFFSRNESVDINEFFYAPYTVYPGESGFDLKFYSSPKAVKIYTLYLKTKMFLPPDDTYHLEKISKGLKFIKDFCQEKQILLSKYLFVKDGVQNQFITHLKQRKISIYNLFAFKDFDKALKENDPEVLRFTLDDLYDQLPVFRTKFLNSQKAKFLATKGLEKVNLGLNST